MEESTNQIEKMTVRQVALKWGLYLGLIYVIWTIIVYMMGEGANQTLNWISSIFTIVAIVLAHREFKSEGDGFMSYSQGLGIGTLVAFVSAVISSVFSFIYIKLIDDSVLQQIKDQSYENMLEQGMSEAQIETAMGFSEPFMKPEVFLPIALVVGVFIGFIISLVISAITKNANPDAEV